MAKVTIHSKHLENIVAGSLGAKWSARGDRILRYYIDVRHKKLNLHKEVSAPEIFILQSKLDALMASWEDKYDLYQKRQSLLSGQSAADELTTEASLALQSLGGILTRTLSIDDRVDWETLKDRSSYAYPIDFPERKPSKITPDPPVYVIPKVGFFDVLLGKKASIIAESEKKYATAMQEWRDAEALRTNIWENDVAEWKNRSNAFWDKHKAQEKAFKEEQAASHAEVDRLAAAVADGEEEAVIEHASLVLERSDYDGLFEKSYLLQYDRPRKLLKLAYDLPSIDTLPMIKAVKFVKATVNRAGFAGGHFL